MNALVFSRGSLQGRRLRDDSDVVLRPVWYWEDPIRQAPREIFVEQGSTLAEMLEALPLQNEHLREYLAAYVSGHRIDRQYFGLRPKLTASNGRPVTVCFHLDLHGKGGRKILGALASLALLAAGPLFGGAGIASLFTKATLGKIALSAGAMVLNMLLQGNPPEPESTPSVKPLGVAGGTNDFDPGGTLQRCIGTIRVRPKLVVPPFTYVDEDDQYVTAVYGLDGPHDADPEFIRIGDVGIFQMAGIEYELRVGLPTDEHLTLVTDTRLEDATAVDLSDFDVDTDYDSKGNAEATGTPEDSKPIFHRFEAKLDADAFKFEFLCPGGLQWSGSESENAGPAIIFFRIRMQQVGSEFDDDVWIYLPDIAIAALEASKGLRTTLELIWVDEFPDTAGNVWERPAESNSDDIKGWYDISAKVAGSEELLTPNVDGGYDQWEWAQKYIKLYLLKSLYPQSRWRFEVMRSFVMKVHSGNDEYDKASKIYSWAGGVDGQTADDFFNFVELPDGRFVTPHNAAYFVQQVQISSRQSIFNIYPIADDDDYPWLLAIRAKNRQLTDVNVVASGLVDDWNGSSWIPLQISTNPAAGFREVIRGSRTDNPPDDSLIDMAEVQDWYEWCTANGKSCSFVAEGRTVADLLKTIAICGFGSPRMGAMFGVVIDRLREEGPVGTISQRNAGSFRFDKPMPLPTHALRVSYADSERDYEIRETIVYGEGYNADGTGGLIEATRFEAQTYEGITNETLALARADFDLLWMRFRNRIAAATMDIEHLEYRRGVLVYYETDILGQEGGSGFIVEVISTSPDDSEIRQSTDLREEGNLRNKAHGSVLVSEIVIDCEPNFGAAQLRLREIENLRTAGNLRLLGAEMGVIIRLGDELGQLLVKEVSHSTADGHIVFAAPFDAPLDLGMLVLTGPLSQVARQMVVLDITPGPDLTAELTLTDYAAGAMYKLPRPAIRSVKFLPFFDVVRVVIRLPDHPDVENGRVWRTAHNAAFSTAVDVSGALIGGPGSTKTFNNTPPSSATYDYWATASIDGVQTRETGPVKAVYTAP